MLRRIGHLVDASDLAENLIAGFHRTADRIARRVEGRPVPPVLLLEWVDPPYSSGHWNPEIIALAVGREVIGRAGERSGRITWDEAAAADPEVIMVAACGFSIDRAEADLESISHHREWRDLRAVGNAHVAVTDGSAYFSRPGPRLEASLRIAAAAIHPEACGDLAPPGSSRFWSNRV